MNTELHRDLLIWHTFCAHFANQANAILGELGLSQLLAIWLSALCNFVCNILLMRSQKEMGRIDATWIIALMTDLHSVWNLTIMEFIRKTMGAHLPKIITLLKPNGQVAISGFGFCRLPLPTIVRAALVNMFPKTSLVIAVSISGCVAWKVAVARIIDRLIATTHAKFWGLEMGRDWGMILHVNSPFTTLTTPQDGSTHRCGNYLLAFIIPQGAAL